MNQKHSQSKYHPNVNVSGMVENVIQLESGIAINVGASLKIKKNHVCEEDIWNPTTCNCENGKYLASNIDNLVITCDEIIEETKTAPKNFNEKNAICKTNILYIPLADLLTTIALLIAVSIYCYLIKHKFYKNIKRFITILRQK